MSGEAVEKLTGKMTGVWAIKTQGSTHLWNLDKMTWVRQQEDGLNPMWKDYKVLHIVKVDAWPKVGESFFVWSTEHEQSVHANWHLSSTIRHIEKINDHG